MLEVSGGCSLITRRKEKGVAGERKKRAEQSSRSKTHGFSELFFCWEEALPGTSLVGFLIIFLITFVLYAFSLWVLVFIHCSNVFALLFSRFSLISFEDIMRMGSFESC